MSDYTLRYAMLRDSGNLPRYTLHGGYPCYYVVDGYRAICATCANERLQEHASDSRNFFEHEYKGLLADCEGDPAKLYPFQRDCVNEYSDPLHGFTYADTHLEGVLYCDDCSELIESAYGCAGDDPYCQDDCCSA